MRGIATHVPAIAERPFLMLASALLVSIAYAAVIDRFIDPYFRRLRHRYRTGETSAAKSVASSALLRSQPVPP
jgi:peptidoglycan/LPS O-acetylase OafA/YrhL